MSTAIEGTRQTSGLRRGLSAGARAGAVAAVAGAGAHLVVAAATDRSYPELTVASVVIVSVIALTAGGAVFSFLAGRVRRPQGAFLALVALAVAAETGAAATRGAGFLFEATVLHVVVAAVAVVLIPRLYGERR